jgi:cytosine/adenosine deaminase-related metal-dependent hydrolase
MKESPIFSKLFDFTAWVIPLTIKFPREHRFVVAEALQRVTLAAHEAAIRAGHAKDPAAIARELDDVALHLSLIRFYLRLALTLTLIELRQHEFASERLTEIGRLLEAWKRVNVKGVVPGVATV